MKFLTALAAACLCASIAVAEPACDPGRSLAEMKEAAGAAVEAGVIAEVLVLECEAKDTYVKTLQASGFPIPDGLSHVVVAIQNDGSAKVFGLVDGCLAGSGSIPAGLHGKAYGVGA
jgi:hypothetical protein